MGMLDQLFGRKEKQRCRYETAADYQSPHDEDDGYQQNNWLEPETQRILVAQPKSLVDWAISPGSRDLPANVTTKQANAVIAGVVRKLHEAGKYNFHVIACYDDNKSHITIQPPAEWPKLFKTFSEDYRLIEVRRRGKHNEREVCVVVNFDC